MLQAGPVHVRTAKYSVISADRHPKPTLTVNLGPLIAQCSVASFSQSVAALPNCPELHASSRYFLLFSYLGEVYLPT